ncbi:MAG: cytochrome c-type biogenesis protein CcmH, partial [Pseudomonadota bacterium]|nr:cytochrome c-type biogenesis protein CcmH [Pseudomonadota bacterium]
MISRPAAWLAALLFALALLPLQAPAVTPEEMLSDPALETRARALSKQLRCLVCQNQSIDDSDAELARDLRIEVRKQLAAGAADDEILAALRETYGDYVLLNPPVSPATYILWGAPAVILIGGAAIMLAGRRRRDETTEDTATETAPSETAAPAIDRRIGMALGSLVMAASLGLYLVLGRADLPAQPLAERGAEIAAALKQAETVAGTRDDALAEARAAAARTPSDVGAWLRLAMAAAASGDRETEMTALQQAETLTDGDPAIRAMRAEAMARAADGQVTVPARRLVAEILAVNPAEPRALFLSGLAAYQDEDYAAAVAIWRRLQASSTPDAPWMTLLAENIADAARAGGIPIDDAAPAAAAAAPRGPDEADIAAATEMSDEDRQAMIESMVDGLAARLAEDPSDAQGWQRLARAYDVLGRPRDAQTALIGAADAAPGDLRLQLAALEQMVVARLEAAFADAASRLLERTRSLAPEHPETLYF